jgi:hypothetical protein
MARAGQNRAAGSVAGMIEEKERGQDVPTLEEVVELTSEQLASYEGMIDGKVAPIGKNFACNGFFIKRAGAQLAGRILTKAVKPNTMNAKTTDTILLIHGMAHYPKDCVAEDTGEIKYKAGKHEGVFAFQLDAATVAFMTANPGDDAHLKIDKRVKLSLGRSRWTYDFARLRENRRPIAG